MDERKLRHCLECKEWKVHIENIKGYQCQTCFTLTKWSPNSSSGWIRVGNSESFNENKFRPHALDRKIKNRGKWQKRSGSDE